VGVELIKNMPVSSHYPTDSDFTFSLCILKISLQGKKIWLDVPTDIAGFS
jgi:hypothetical protein